MVEEQVMKVRLTFLQDVLGTQPTDSKIYESFLATKMRKEMEKSGYKEEKIDEKINKGMEALPNNEDGEFYRDGVTVFPRLKIKETGEEIPAIEGYLLKGFFKNACWACAKADGLSAELSAYKKYIDNMTDVNEISPIIVNDDVKKYMEEHKGTLPLFQRPIRISDRNGERVALACSEYVPAGSYIDFEITAMSEEALNFVIEWLNYGKHNGLCCWRNSGKGKFDWIDLDLGAKREINPKAIKKKGKKKKADDEE